jgi:hypothetical protein
MTPIDSPARPRPVGIVTVLAIFLCFAAFLIVIHFAYHPTPLLQAIDVPGDKLPPDQAWNATPEARLDYLQELRAKHEKQLSSYAWIDRKKGIVQLPIERAMELVVQKYGQPAGKASSQ